LAGSAASDPGITALLERLRIAEQEYDRAREELAESLEDLALLLGDDDAVRELEVSYSAVDAVVARLTSALEEDPSRPDRIHRLVVYYGSQTRSMARTSSFVKDLRK
jgi:CHASE3 domain sensor protein